MHCALDWPRHFGNGTLEAPSHMLRLPPFRYHRPDTVQDAVSLLAEYAESAIPVSGGTDLIPNMKHRLFTPAHLVALKGIGELKGGDQQGDYGDQGRIRGHPNGSPGPEEATRAVSERHTAAGHACAAV